MNIFTMMLFRILLVVGGLILLYIIGKPLVTNIQNKISGVSVQGVIVGFRGRGTSHTVFDDNTSKRPKKWISRRPVFKYPAVQGSLDSLTGFESSSILLPWLNFDKGDHVDVVFGEGNPSQAQIFSWGIFFSDIVMILFCFFMIWLGIPKPK